MPKAKSTLQRYLAKEITEEQALALYTEGLFRRNIKMGQNAKALALGDITESEIMETARQQAEEELRKQVERAGEERRAEAGEPLSAEDRSAYRIERESFYSHVFEKANEANDYISLMNLIDLEVQIHAIKWDLQNPKMKEIDQKNKRESLVKLIEAHTKLQKDLGIDMKTRDHAKANKSPMEKFEDQMRRAHLFRMDLLDNFPTEADNILMKDEDAELGGERALRELLKARLGLRFVLIDAIIRNVKRLNGLPATVDQYE